MRECFTVICLLLLKLLIPLLHTKELHLSIQAYWYCGMEVICEVGSKDLNVRSWNNPPMHSGV